MSFSRRRTTHRCVFSYATLMFLFLWPWSWPDDLDMRTLSRYCEDVQSAYQTRWRWKWRLSKVWARTGQTHRRTRPNLHYQAAFANGSKTITLSLPSSSAFEFRAVWPFGCWLIVVVETSLVPVNVDNCPAVLVQSCFERGHDFTRKTVP